MSWEQLREMAASGLVEIASHSHNMHRGVQGNPQGNELPALNTRAWLADAGRYETEKEWRARVRADLRQSVEIIKRQLGQAPRTMVWPYGQYNQPAIEIAADLGMTRTLTLDTAHNSVDNLSAIARILISEDPTTANLAWQVEHRFDRQIRRVAHVDLDYLYDIDQEQQHRNLSQLLDRIKALRINTVFLQAYADPDGDGGADQLYFPNRHLPMRADLFNRVAWQLKTRAGVDIFAWLPMLAFTVDGAELVQRLDPQTGKVDVDPQAHQRLSPFSAQNRQVIAEIYEDLAAHANFAGILFSDDGMLSDFEDAAPPALAHYKGTWKLPPSINEIRQDRAAMAAWTGHKTAELINLTGQLMQAVNKWRPRSKSARNIFALPVLNPHSESWFAQELQAFAEAYDWVAVMAMPWMEGAEKPNEWLVDLVDQVKRYPGVLDKTIFELQTLDWSQNNRPIPTQVTAQQMGLLLRNGVRSYGYYPDLFTDNHPEMKTLRPAISLREFPYLRR
jgi:biofilm PGA synthesis lipoprotein PgaB